MFPIRRSLIVLPSALTLAPLWLASPAAALQRAPLAAPQINVDERFQPSELWVRFRAGLHVRKSGDDLTDFGAGVLMPVRGALATLGPVRWERCHSAPEERLDELRERAQIALGRTIADLNLDFRLHVPSGVDLQALLVQLRALAPIAAADRIPLPARAPQAPDFQYKQGYLEPGTRGASAGLGWGVFDPAPLHPAAAPGTGTLSKIGDIEYSFDPLHVDLPSVTYASSYPPADPFSDTNHGTGVLGMLVAKRNDSGVTGACFGAQAYFAAAVTTDGYKIEAAITDLMNNAGFGAGDVILIEQQVGVVTGPGQIGLLPAEWFAPVYSAIQTAVGNGIVVVEAAGNGNQNLDDPMYGGYFSVANDSGAIMVGAGAAPGGSDVDRSRLLSHLPVPDWGSNYGSTVDLQGWGELVTTCGAGNLYPPGGIHERYTEFFSGTSSASPMVAAACVQLQSIHKYLRAGPLTPAQVREVLRGSGSPQQSGSFANPSSQNIGPRPDLLEALHGLRLIPCGGWSQGFDDPHTGLGIDGPVLAFATFDDDGPGPRATALYAAGTFTEAGAANVQRIARWSGGAWSALGTGLNGTVFALCSHDPDGPGPQPEALYAGGVFTVAGGVTARGIARWNGTNWSAVGAGIQGAVHAVASFDEDGAGPQPAKLFAAGKFTTAGGFGVNNIAAWDGFNWSPVGLGLDDHVFALEVHDPDGSFPQPPLLVAGGDFTQEVGFFNGFEGLAVWDGSGSWQPLGIGGGVSSSSATPQVRALCSQPATPGQTFLWVGGQFDTIQGHSITNAAAWWGFPGFSNWIPSNVTMTSGLVFSIEFAQRATPPNTAGIIEGDVIIGGDFTGSLTYSGQPVQSLVRVSGTGVPTGTLPMGGVGANGPVFALGVWDEDGVNPRGPAVYAGGMFTSIDGPTPVASSRIARWDHCALQVQGYCQAKPASWGCTPVITSVGIPSASQLGGFTIYGWAYFGGKPGLLFYGFKGKSSAPFQGGTLCVAPPIRRTPVIFSGGAPSPCQGDYSIDMNAFAHTPTADPALAQVGQRVNCQWWGRDNGYPAPHNTSLSDAIEYVVGQ